jgi:hypothetical protein
LFQYTLTIASLFYLVKYFLNFLFVIIWLVCSLWLVFLTIFIMSKVRNQVEKAGERFLLELGEILQSQLTDEVREYPRVTIRRAGVGKTGQVAGSPRDVVDSGELRDSYSATITKTVRGIQCEYRWDAGHAALVYTGASLPSGTEIPPYPWVHNGLNTMDMDGLIRKNFS